MASKPVCSRRGQALMQQATWFRCPHHDSDKEDKDGREAGVLTPWATLDTASDLLSVSPGELHEPVSKLA